MVNILTRIVTIAIELLAIRFLKEEGFQSSLKSREGVSTFSTFLGTTCKLAFGAESGEVYWVVLNCILLGCC